MIQDLNKTLVNFVDKQILCKAVILSNYYR